MSIQAHTLDDSLSDFVLAQVAIPDLADEVLSGLQRDYDLACQRADAAKRELARLDQEIETLEHNYHVIKLTSERAAKLEADIANLMDERRRLTQVDTYPAGRVTQALIARRLSILVAKRKGDGGQKGKPLRW